MYVIKRPHMYEVLFVSWVGRCIQALTTSNLRISNQVISIKEGWWWRPFATPASVKMVESECQDVKRRGGCRRHCADVWGEHLSLVPYGQQTERKPAFYCITYVTNSQWYCTSNFCMTLARVLLLSLTTTLGLHAASTEPCRIHRGTVFRHSAF